MKLLIIVLCLLSERYLTHKISLNRFDWFGKYCDKLRSILPEMVDRKKTWILLVLVMIPIVAVVGFALGLLNSILLGFIGFLIQLFIFYYCLGPANVFYPISANKEKQDKEEHEAGNYLASVNNQLFGVMFWYILLGPIAVLLYRLISLCQTQSPFTAKAVWLTSILDWIPARLTAVLYLLVGNFEQGFNCFIQKILAVPAENNELLTEVGLLAAHSHDDDKISLPLAQGLVEHALILALALLALFTMVSWL